VHCPLQSEPATHCAGLHLLAGKPHVDRSCFGCRDHQAAPLATLFLATRLRCSWCSPPLPRRLRQQPRSLRQPRRSTAGQLWSFSVGVTATAGPTPSGTVTLLDGSTSLGTSSLTNGTLLSRLHRWPPARIASLRRTPGTAADAASTSNAVSVQVNAVQRSNRRQQPPWQLHRQRPIRASNHTHGDGHANFRNVTERDRHLSGWQHFYRVHLWPGQGVLTVSTLSVGTHSITAAYGGDAANLASTSNPVTVTITARPLPPSPTPPPTTGLRFRAALLPCAQGTPGSLTVTVAPENGFTLRYRLPAPACRAGGDAALLLRRCRGISPRAPR
jgi:hypothetical protein